jgi:hypothetical protein
VPYACVLKKFSVGDNFDLSGFGSRSTEPIESISFRIRIHNTVKKGDTLVTKTVEKNPYISGNSEKSRCKVNYEEGFPNI